MQTIDLNADLGEGVTDDVGLLTVVTSANVACGYHAGDEDIMRFVCTEAASRAVVVGAQVSYDDREGFGRRHLEVPFETLREQVAHQVGLLDEIARACGTRVAYVKPHGALYNRVVHDEVQARAVLGGSGDLPVLGLPGSVFLELAVAVGREVHLEGFPDRAYTPEGRLVPRDQPGAVHHEPSVIAARALEMARSGQIASVCVHGDSPAAVHSAAEVRRTLEAAGLTLRSFA
ncbi:MAG TPA: 5-oxoprolinase subunit PxpA [Nocardioidaceae bacterium]|nr:5-oxoprolinase subunit PxpA [Nocardioidaceae bacterium]